MVRTECMRGARRSATSCCHAPVAGWPADGSADILALRFGGIRMSSMLWNSMRMVAASALLAAVTAAAQSSPPLIADKEIPLPGVEGRIDHLSVDVKGQRLFVSALGNGTVEVIDLHAGRVLREIKGLEEP